MFKVNNKDTRTKPVPFVVNLFYTLWKYFTPFSSVSIVNLEQVNAGWVTDEVWTCLLPSIDFVFLSTNLK